MLTRLDDLILKASSEIQLSFGSDGRSIYFYSPILMIHIILFYNFLPKILLLLGL